MNRERAISLLNYTASPLPAEDDPEWEELVAFLEADPSLQAWFTSQSPADALLEDVLAKLPETRTTAPPAKVITPPTNVWTRRRWLVASAAGVAATLGGGAWVLERPTNFAHADGPSDFAGFREDMARFADRLFRLNKKSESPQTLITFLTEKGGDTPTDWKTLPPKIADKPARGCRVIDWGQQRVGLICFLRDERQVVHLFSIKTSSLRSQTPAADMRAPTVLHGRECCGWVQGDYVHLLVGAKPGVPVQDLLA